MSVRTKVRYLIMRLPKPSGRSSLSSHIDWYDNFTSSFPVPLEKLVVTREHMNNWYSLEAYHISKLLAELPLQVSCLHIEIRRSYRK